MNVYIDSSVLPYQPKAFFNVAEAMRLKTSSLYKPIFSATNISNCTVGKPFGGINTVA